MSPTEPRSRTEPIIPTEREPRQRIRGAGLLRLYPRPWRRRYEAEMLDVLEASAPGPRARLDLVRGALDAWLHPAAPSVLPPLTAFVGGVLWTAVALGVMTQPVPPDWPGYLSESLLLASLAATLLGVAVVGAWLRGGDGGSALAVLGLDLAVAGHLAWAAALLAAAASLDYGAPTAVGQTAAAIGTVAVGLHLLARAEAPVGFLLVVAGVGLLVPAAAGWLVSGLAWILVGAVEGAGFRIRRDGGAVAA